jgi:hypothetical protein
MPVPVELLRFFDRAARSASPAQAPADEAPGNPSLPTAPGVPALTSPVGTTALTALLNAASDAPATPA